MDTRAEIEKLTADFAKAVTARDMKTIVAFYEDGARFLPPGSPAARGRAEIEERQKSMLALGMTSLTLECVDLLEVGDVAIEIGRQIVTMQPPGAPEPKVLDGKSIVVWRRQGDGTLKIWADILNGDTL